MSRSRTAARSTTTTATTKKATTTSTKKRATAGTTRTAGRKKAPARKQRPSAARAATSRPTTSATTFISRTGKRLIKRRSGIAGWGIYAGEPITKNTRIIDYDGERISHAESRIREERQVAEGHIWCFTVHNRLVRDAAVGGNDARFINHACKPNCYVETVKDMIWIRAARNIRRGEELTYDYNTGGGAEISCQCRPGCTGRL